MFKQDDKAPPRRGLGTLVGVTGLAIVSLLLQLPIANAGVAQGEDPAVAPTPAPPAATQAAKPSGRYQLRCWQYGRLLFDEGPVSLAADARVGARLVAYDRNGAPLIVTDAGGATCLARPAAAPPNPAMQR